MFSGGYRSGTLVENGLTIISKIFKNFCYCHPSLSCYFDYSCVWNKRPGTFINFQENFHPRHTYSSHPVYLFLKLFPPTPFIWDAFFSLPEHKTMKK